jgi:Cu-processing system ATP-binding protein
MKTLSFHNLKIGRPGSATLIEIDSTAHGIELKPGLTLLIAPNGYGKTSLLQTIAGVLPPQAGKVQIGPGPLNPRRDVLYVSEYLTFPKFIYPSEWIDFMADRRVPPGELLLWIQKFLLQEKMGRFMGRLSQGERRKVTWLGAAACSNPLTLLDEPLDGLDLLGIQCARALLSDWKAKGRITCVVAHQVGELLDLSDQVLLISKSRTLVPWKSVFEKSPAEIPAEEFRQILLSYYA